MNILPKKRWHVRTKDNIARVRRDEAKAAAEEKSKQERIQLAEREARTKLLRERAHKRVHTDDFMPYDTSCPAPDDKPTNVNLFLDLEEQTAELKQTNKEHEKEKKEEQEKYEKQIGYLQYLGQDTNEALGKKNWYDVAPNRLEPQDKKEEVNLKSKSLEDPLVVIQKLLDNKNKHDKKPIANVKTLDGKKKAEKLLADKELAQKSLTKLCSKIKKCKKKHKKKKSKKYKKEKRKYESSDDSEDTEKLEKEARLKLLREERLSREREERKRAEAVMTKLKEKQLGITKPPEAQPTQQRYHSQFNPELAKQNSSPPKIKRAHH